MDPRKHNLATQMMEFLALTNSTADEHRTDWFP